MPSNDMLLILLLVAAVAMLALQVVLLLRGRGDTDIAARLDALKDDNERLQRALREEQRAGREELQQGFDRFRGHVGEQLGSTSQQQLERIDAFGQRLATLTDRTERGLDALRNGLAEDARKAREDQRQTLGQFGEQMQARLAAVAEGNERRMGEVRTTLDAQLKALQQDNAQQLEKMRATVDEKLHATLETRLTESFGNVTKMLAQVHQGLGDMTKLAADVGGLQRVLTNVKSRGVFGEVQLAGLLEQVFTPDQYAANVATVPGSAERVEFAVKFPGSSHDEPVWLPIDAKFPREDYERLLDAQDRADADAARAAGDALERRVREEAKRIRSKYVAPPHSTEFAVLFLPTEGLYAEVLRRPGLFEAMQREHRITLAGPTTLLALLTSLQVGFRTVAIEKRSSEVWRILGAAKTEFGKFGDVLDNVKNKLDQASKQIDQTGVRTRAIERKLRGVESLPGEDAARLLGAGEADTDSEA
ncbi:MAG TPA: DNA recombination protein RmuC [Dyella sp.]|nr:DNA recombination protein RmuC [Dyella sp.]